MVIQMELRNKLFAILAVFCVLLSACAVSADDNGDFSADEAQAIHDGMVLPPDYAHNESQNASGEDLDSEAVHDSMILPPDYAHNEAAMANATNSTGHAAGEAVSNSTGNTTAAHSMPATGNPILLLLGVGAVLGGACVLKRKN